MTSFTQTVAHLRTKKHPLLLTTSNRWKGEKGGERPKSTQLAYSIQKILGPNVRIIEVPDLHIYPCEGNVSTARGNTCGLKEAALQDAENEDPEKYKEAPQAFEKEFPVGE